MISKGAQEMNRLAQIAEEILNEGNGDTIVNNPEENFMNYMTEQEMQELKTFVLSSNMPSSPQIELIFAKIFWAINDETDEDFKMKYENTDVNLKRSRIGVKAELGFSYDNADMRIRKSGLMEIFNDFEEPVWQEIVNLW